MLGVWIPTRALLEFTKVKVPCVELPAAFKWFTCSSNKINVSGSDPLSIAIPAWYPNAALTPALASPWLIVIILSCNRTFAVEISTLEPLTIRLPVIARSPLTVPPDVASLVFEDVKT